jgi:YggT family protein
MMASVVFAPLLPYSFAAALSAVVNFYVILIIAWAILSWFDSGKEGFVSDLYRILDRIVSPYINLFRRFIPAAGGIDFSPLIAIILLQVVLQGILRFLA